MMFGVYINNSFIIFISNTVQFVLFTG